MKDSKGQDSDGDGLPDAWEIQFSHDPNDSSDKSADFDNDGLTALQEYNDGVGGTNPLGNWTGQLIHTPPYANQYSGNFPYRPSLVEVNSNGQVLVNLHGPVPAIVPDDFSGTSPYKKDRAYVWSPDDGWTQVRTDFPYQARQLWGTDLTDDGRVCGNYRATYNLSGAASGYFGFIWSEEEGFVTHSPTSPVGRYLHRMNDYGDLIGKTGLEDGKGSAAIVAGELVEDLSNFDDLVWHDIRVCSKRHKKGLYSDPS